MNENRANNHNTREPRLHEVFISLGSNIHPEKNLPEAVALLMKWVTILEVSSVWETQPTGTTGPNFLNAMVIISTALNAEHLKNDVLRSLEAALGRVRTPDKYSPRSIDLDIIVYNNEVIDSRLWSELYLAAPLSELRPDFALAGRSETIRTVVSDLLKDNLLIQREDIILPKPPLNP